MAIAAARVNGATLTQIGEMNGGMPKSTVHLRLEKPELKAYLEDIQSRTINETAKEASENLTYLIKGYKNNNCEDVKARIEKSHGFKASERICESIGILPSHAPSQMVINIMQTGNTYISPIVTEMLSRMMPASAAVPALGLDVIDVQPEPDKLSTGKDKP